MIYKCELQNELGKHLYVRGPEEEVYDFVDGFFLKHEEDVPMIVDHTDRENDEVFVHLMYTPPNLYCEKCDVEVNSRKQMEHHIKGKKHNPRIFNGGFACAIF